MEGKIGYMVGEHRFPTAAKAIEYAFSVMATENVNWMGIEKIRNVEPYGFMNLLDYEVIDTLHVQGPASYKQNAMVLGF